MSSSSSSNATTGPPMPSKANSDDNDTNGSSINHSTTSLLRSSSSCSIPYQSVASTTTNTTNNAQPREPSPKELLHTLQSSGSVHNSDTNKVTSSSSAASSARAAPPPSTGANPIVVQQSPQDPPVNERRLTIPELAYHVTHSTSSTTPQIPKTSQYHGNLPEGSQIVPCRARGMPQDHDLMAYLIIPPNAKHGYELLCSHEVCRLNGPKFRYCKFCNIPAGKHNFRIRHSHPDLVQQDGQAIHEDVGTSLSAATASASSSSPKVHGLQASIASQQAQNHLLLAQQEQHNTYSRVGGGSTRKASSNLSSIPTKHTFTSVSEGRPQAAASDAITNSSVQPVRPDELARPDPATNTHSSSLMQGGLASAQSTAQSFAGAAPMNAAYTSALEGGLRANVNTATVTGSMGSQQQYQPSMTLGAPIASATQPMPQLQQYPQLFLNHAMQQPSFASNQGHMLQGGSNSAVTTNPALAGGAAGNVPGSGVIYVRVPVVTQVPTTAGLTNNYYQRGSESAAYQLHLSLPSTNPVAAPSTTNAPNERPPASFQGLLTAGTQPPAPSVPAPSTRETIAQGNTNNFTNPINIDGPSQSSKNFQAGAQENKADDKGANAAGASNFPSFYSANLPMWTSQGAATNSASYAASGRMDQQANLTQMVQQQHHSQPQTFALRLGTPAAAASVPRGGDSLGTNSTKPIIVMLGAPIPASSVSNNCHSAPMTGSSQGTSSSPFANMIINSGSSAAMPSFQFPSMHHMMQPNEANRLLSPSSQRYTASSSTLLTNTACSAESTEKRDKSSALSQGEAFNQSHHSQQMQVPPTSAQAPAFANISSGRPISTESSVSGVGGTTAPQNMASAANNSNSISTNTEGSLVSGTTIGPSTTHPQQPMASTQPLQQFGNAHTTQQAPHMTTFMPATDSYIPTANDNGAPPTAPFQAQIPQTLFNQQAFVYLQQVLASMSSNSSVMSEQAIQSLTMTNGNLAAATQVTASINEVSNNSGSSSNAETAQAVAAPLGGQSANTSGTSANDGMAGIGTGSSGGSTDVSSIIQDKKLPSVRHTEYSTKVPCRARGMPPDHNYKVAHFIVPAKVKHGYPLVCSYPACRDQGVKFCFCVYCNMPVAKRNFRSRHNHYDLGPPKDALLDHDVDDAVDRHPASAMPATAMEMRCQPVGTTVKASSASSSLSSRSQQNPNVARLRTPPVDEIDDENPSNDGSAGANDVHREDQEEHVESTLHRSSKKKTREKDRKRKRHHSRCRDVNDGVDVKDDDSDASMPNSRHRRHHMHRHREVSSPSSRRSDSSSSDDHGGRERTKKEKKRHKKAKTASSSSRRCRRSSSPSKRIRVDDQYDECIRHVMTMFSEEQSNEFENQYPVVLSSESSLS